MLSKKERIEELVKRQVRLVNAAEKAHYMFENKLDRISKEADEIKAELEKIKNE